MINDFPINKSYNLGGLASFLFIHFTGILTYSGVFDSKIITPLSLVNAAAWFKGYSTMQTLNYTEVQKTGVQGKYYEQTISGFAPGDKESLIKLMESLDDQYFVLQVLDNNKQTRLVGGYGYPMLFSSNFDSGSGRADAKGYQFKFYSESPHRAPVYL